MSIEQNSFSSIISVNPYNDEYFSGISSLLTQTTSAEYSKTQLAVSYLNTQEYISNTIEISRNIPDEDLYDAINIKIYDEIGLDQAVEYQFQYIETFNNVDNENRTFQVFIVDPKELEERFQNVINTIKYIDIITPTPLLLKSLYTKNIINDNGVHCFIYFEDHDAFISVYNEKEFLFSKSLKYSLSQMHEKFCEFYGEKIEYSEFTDFLTMENLKFTSSDYKEFILKLYKEVFTNINEVLNSQKLIFSLKSIDRIYIGSQLDMASKLYEMAEVELGIEASDFHFDYGYDQTDTYIDEVHSLMHVTAMLSGDEKYDCNFSIFPRPPKFSQRESGKILMLTAASFFIAFIYPVTYWVLLNTQEIQHKLLTSSYNEIHRDKVARESALKSKQADKEKVLALLQEEEKHYNNKKNTLIKIHDVKVNYPMKAKLITTLTKDLNKYKINLEEISYNENDKKELTLKLLSSNDKKITQLLEYLTKTYSNQFRLSLENISYRDEEKIYSSELRVEL